ncbi:glycerate kinase type-2 family protein [Pyrococcus yayanosii]|uniref:Putative glycerate kinase n=1 Tax=Pyrococcus yayanosii (strain CH1 / JCM 16557) TaxID=529709 RepID=F8AGT2_PYRYC|nr:glycerate kinase [Pyrococcus yayanosii]AEH25218.1 Putative glycerate kinase [Pyrococcus yayanosii CH1]
MNPRDVALTLVREAIRAADPYLAVKRALRIEDGKIIVQGKVFGVRGRIYVLAFGKAACEMARAVEDVLGEGIASGIAVTKYGYGRPLRRIKVIEAGHPIPDENSIRGAEEGLRLVERVGSKDILLVLISGGGSALFELPEDGITLEDIKKTNDLLLKSGARIHEINTVRKHISKVKGGKLAKRVKGTLVALIISDVVGDDLEAIASGPTVKDPTTFEDAHRVLRLYGLWAKVPESVKAHIERGLRGEAEETLKEDLPNVHNFLIASNSIACEAVAAKARELGFNPYILTTTMEGEAKDAGLILGAIVQRAYWEEDPFRKPAVLIAGGETTVTITGDAGMGGPNQELALSIARKIAGLKGVVVVAFDTDGTDGPTDAAGGIVDWETLKRLEAVGLRIEEVLAKHNAYRALKVVGALLFTGPTGTNVNSMVIAVIWRIGKSSH